MKKNINNQEPIEIQLVYTHNNQVYTKNEEEEWLSVPFQWIPIPTR